MMKFLKKILMNYATLRPKLGKIMQNTELKRNLTLYGLTMVAIGGTIGSGIFRTPWKIAEAVHLPEYIILIWVIGGIIALTGALTFAEMGSMFPGAGGLYVYIREAYGDTAGFLYGWFILLVSTSGSIAALAVVCAEHLDILFHIGPNTVKWLAGVIIIASAALNILGAKIGELAINIFTGAKLLGIVLIIILGLFFASSGLNPAPLVSSTTDYTRAPTGIFGAFALALIGVLWSYGGWQHASYLAGETPNPQRTVPRAMIIGATVVTIVYVLANIAYLNLLPVPVLAGSKTVAAVAVERVWAGGGKLIAAMIAVSTLGTCIVYSLSAPRIYFAMAKDGVFFKKLAEVHPKFGTPMNAILIQTIWSVFLLLFWGTFENLIEYVTFMDWIWLMLVGTTIFVFRRRLPNQERGYRTIGYPITPIIFISICCWFVLFTLIQKPVQAGAGIIVIALGLAVYYSVFRKNKTKPLP
jgi:basic amino acid/polyamine antiporter, APA family